MASTSGGQLLKQDDVAQIVNTELLPEGTKLEAEFQGKEVDWKSKESSYIDEIRILKQQVGETELMRISNEELRIKVETLLVEVSMPDENLYGLIFVSRRCRK